VSADAISALERGTRRRPYASTIGLLASALGLSAAERAAFGQAVPGRARARSHSDAVGTRPGAPPTNLPAPAAALIGRQRELDALRDLVVTGEQRLVTLTGVGGCGKTSLALRVAADLVASFRDGVWLVELDAVAEGSMVAQAIAMNVGVREVPGRELLATLVASLRRREILIVLDNCEHLIEDCAVMAARLLAACPGVRFLATSREPLRITGERQWRVDPLDVPALDGPTTLDAVAGCSAVQLFVARAQATAPRFALTSESSRAVAEVCARLDGLPLALEMAAARVRVLTVEQIGERLDDGLRLLIGSSRNGPTRQQTLRATLDWSHALLNEPEQALLRRLAVFAGGCDLDAATAVCSGGDILDLLGRLVDKSLVLVDDGGRTARYRLHELVRQYERQQLEAAGESAAVAGRHAAYYLELAERAELALRGGFQVTWLRRLALEQENLRAALRWARDSCAVTLGLRLAASLTPYWDGYGYSSEGRRWLATLLDSPRSSDVVCTVRARALFAAGCLAHWEADHLAAVGLFTESLELARGSCDWRAVADCLRWLGVTHRHLGDLTLATSLGEESLAMNRALGDERAVALAVHDLAISARHAGDTVRATTLGEEALAGFQRVGDILFSARARTMLGFAVLRCGAVPRAAALFAEALREHESLDDRWFIAHGFMGLAAVLGTQGRPGSAARLLGAAERLRADLGAPEDLGRTTYEPIVSQIRAQLTRSRFVDAWRSGYALTRDQVLRVAIARAATIASAGPGPPQPQQRIGSRNAPMPTEPRNC
jgi:non-specific serine/threonine protein kinase